MSCCFSWAFSARVSSSYVFAGGILFVIPPGNGQRRHFVQHFLHADRFEIFLGVAVAAAEDGAIDIEAVGSQFHQQRTAGSGIVFSVAVNAALEPGKTVAAAKIGRGGLDADAVFGAPQVQHLAGLAAAEKAGVRIQLHAALGTNTELIWP